MIQELKSADLAKWVSFDWFLKFTYCGTSVLDNIFFSPTKHSGISWAISTRKIKAYSSIRTMQIWIQSSCPKDWYLVCCSSAVGYQTNLFYKLLFNSLTINTLLQLAERSTVFVQTFVFAYSTLAWSAKLSRWKCDHGLPIISFHFNSVLRRLSMPFQSRF